MEFNINFDTLNDAVKTLSYVRVYQSPVDKENVFNIEVEGKNGGSYEMLKQLIKLAEYEGYKYDKYWEMNDCFGEYHYTAKMYVDEGKVRCYYSQDGVYVVDE